MQYINIMTNIRVGPEMHLFMIFWSTPGFSTVKYDKIWACEEKSWKMCENHFPTGTFLMASSYVKWKSQSSPNIVE